MRKPLRLPCCVGLPVSRDVTRLLVSRTLPSFAAFVPNGFRGDCSYPMAVVHRHAASGSSPWGACLLPLLCDHPWFPAPQGGSRTMFSPSTTAASSHLPGGFETAHRGLEGRQQGRWHQASRAIQVQS